MLRIAICDDNIHFLEQIHRLTQAALMRLDDSLEPMIETYDDGVHLVEKIHDGSRYDIVLLDWDMPILGGEATGQALRVLDNECLIIFITALGVLSDLKIPCDDPGVLRLCGFSHTWPVLYMCRLI